MLEETSNQADPTIDFDSFMQFAEGADWENIGKVVNQKTIKPEEFFAVIPPAVAQFAVILRTPWVFDALASQVPDSAQEKLQSAKRIVDERFSGIEEHPLATKFARDRAQRAITSVGKIDSNLLAEFTGFEATPIWLETKHGLTPASTVVVKGNNKIVFRETLSWDEISFLAFVFADLLKAEFERAVKMAESQALSIPNRAALSRRLEEMAGVVSNLRDIGVSLGIKHSEAEPSVKPVGSVTK